MVRGVRLKPAYTRRQALVELVFAGVLWGFGFVATIWALRAFSPSELLAWRFAIAVVSAEVFRSVYMFFRKGSLTWLPNRGDTLRAIPAGLFLAGMLLPQTIGLQSTSASKSGFLTALYVIFVPVLSHFALKRPQTLKAFLYAGLALLGAYILMGADLSTLNPGDLWTLLCALIASFHILYIERISPKIRDHFRFNTLQTVFCAIPLIPVLGMQSEIHYWSNDVGAWIGILSLALGSSLIGFTIQLRAQQVLDSATASMLFLLESPIALIFGVLLLNEVFGWQQAVGAALISLAAILTTRLSPHPGSK